MKPLKKFGQNYLHDKNILKKIFQEIDPQEGETVVEIGPGKGALTGFLNSSKANIYAVEIDTRVIDDLKARFHKINFINKDFLKIGLNEFDFPPLRIIGNIPYNITSPIIFKCLENPELVKDAVLLMQLEVAERIIAAPRRKEYGILSVIVQAFADVKICFKVSPNVFTPKPKVESALVHFFFKEKFSQLKNKKIFIQIVKAAFGNRRKTLKNSFANSIFAGVNFMNSNIDLSLRAEQLTIEDFINLSNSITIQT